MSLTASADISLRKPESKSILSHVSSVFHINNLFTPTGFREMIFKGPLNSLLIAIPLAFLSWGLKWPEISTFILSLISLAPLAERLGFVTEQLALHSNDTIGGLLNATFGNSTELIVSIAALLKGYYRLIQLSLLGSILSNLLLVMGCSFFFGGLKFQHQKFGILAGQMNSVMLVLATMAIIFPAVLDMADQDTPEKMLFFSRSVSIVLLIMYSIYIYYQLTYSKLEPEDKQNLIVEEQKYSMGIEDGHPIGNAISSESVTLDQQANINNTTNNDDEDEEEEKVLGIMEALLWLLIITVLIAVLSEALVETIEKATKENGIPSVFACTIIIPIVGNAAEHASAVVFARKNKLDLSVGIAIGSSTQIAVFVIPLLVVLSWMSGQSLGLDFHPYETCTMVFAVVLISFAIQKGESNWLLGVVLIGAYILVSLGFLAHRDEVL